MTNEKSEKKIEKYNEGTITCIFGERKKKMNENTPEKRLTYPNELFEGKMNENTPEKGQHTRTYQNELYEGRFVDEKSF